MNELHTRQSLQKELKISPSTMFYGEIKGCIPKPSQRNGSRAYYTAVEIEAVRRYYLMREKLKNSFCQNTD